MLFGVRNVNGLQCIYIQKVVSSVGTAIRRVRVTDYSCEYYFGHEPGEVCQHCGLEVDEYGNTEDDFINCCFPNCGCHGNRNCMAPSGANYMSMTLNHQKGDFEK